MLTGLRIFGGAVVGGFAAIAGGFVLLAIIGILLYGPFGFLMGFYFAGGLILYGGPFGMAFGAIITIIWIDVKHRENKPNQQENYPHRTKASTIFWIGLSLIVISGLAVIPFVMTNVNREVTHGARWYFTAELTEDRFMRSSRPCPIDAVVLVLTEHTHYEVVCSSVLNTYLRSHAEPIVPITYRVTYDFGDPRSYQLIQVGETPITWSNWRGGANSCGSDPLHACNSPQAERGSPLYESSWEDNG